MRQIRCSRCGATRRQVSLWGQIVAIATDLVCCWGGAES
jgi:hypothetical protein